MSFIVKIKLQLIVNWYKTEIIGWRKPSFLRDSLRECLRYNNNILESILSGISIWHQDLKMQILLLLYIGPMIRLHTEKHLLVFLRKQSKLNRAAFLIIKMHLQKLSQTSFAVGNTRIQERILIFHIRHGV